MKKLLTLIIFKIFMPVSLLAQCPNGNAEDGNFGYWETRFGTFKTSLNNMNTGTPPGRTDIIGNPFSDPTQYPMITNNNDNYSTFQVPNEGNYAFRIGNNETGAEKEAMWYKFTVTSANANFYFRYAVVLNDGGHPSKKQPHFSWFMNVLYNSKGKTEPHLVTLKGVNFSQDAKLDEKLFYMTKTEITANKNNPFFQTSTSGSNDGPVIYKTWQCQQYDLTPFIGKEVSIYFESRDCKENGHFGYGYVDGLCDALPAIASFTLNKSVFCDNGVHLMMDGTASQGEDRYYIEIAESYDPAGNSINSNNVISGWTLGQQAGVEDLDNWLNDHGAKWKCDTWYKIKLAVMNECALWNEQSRMVFYQCPHIDAGPDNQRCCLDPAGQFTIGTPAIAGYTYNWTSNPAGFTSSSATNTVWPATSTEYTLTVTDGSNGCKAKDDVDIFVLGKFDVSIDYSPIPDLDCDNPTYIAPEHCNGILTANIIHLNCSDEPADPFWNTKNESRFHYLWNTGETTKSITPQVGITSYRCEVTNGCHTVVQTKDNIIANQYFSHHISNNPNDLSDIMIAPTAFTPNGDGNNDVFFVSEYGPNSPLQGTGPAYWAYKYSFEIFDRWGNEFDIEKCNPNGFLQREIVWDGNDNNGNPFPEDVYIWRLKLYNCQYPNGVYAVIYTQKMICKKWKTNWLNFLTPFVWDWFEKDCDDIDYVDEYKINNVLTLYR